MPINDYVLRPEWFISTESILTIVSFIITLIISIYSYKVYRLLNNKKYYYLAVGFFSIALGFLFSLISNSVIIFFHSFATLAGYIPLMRTSYFYTASLVLYAFLILSGYVIFSCLALGVRNKRVIFALTLIALLSAVLIRQTRSFTFFYFFAFVLLAVHIVPYMHDNYKKQKSKGSYIVFLAFLLLAIANFIFIGINLYGAVLFVVGNSISFVAYVLLLINLFLVGKK